MKFVLFREQIIDDIIEVVSLDELLSLVAWVHGHPAKLILLLFSLHEVPHRLPHHGNWLHAWEQQETTGLINFNSRPKKLSCTNDDIHQINNYCFVHNVYKCNLYPLWLKLFIKV